MRIAATSESELARKEILVSPLPRRLALGMNIRKAVALVLLGTEISHRTIDNEVWSSLGHNPLLTASGTMEKSRVAPAWVAATYRISEQTFESDTTAAVISCQSARGRRTELRTICSTALLERHRSRLGRPGEGLYRVSKRESGSRSHNR